MGGGGRGGGDLPIAPQPPLFFYTVSLLLQGDGVEAAIRLSLRPASWPDGQLASLPLSDLLERLGQTPLPPYIQRAPLPSDVAAYQTVYADAAQTGATCSPHCVTSLQP